MLAGGYSWRLYFYVEIAFAGALLILAFLFVEETSYKRHTPSEVAISEENGERKVFSKDEVEKDDVPVDQVEVETMVPPRRSYLAQLKPWSGINRDEEFFMTIARSFTYYLVPSVVWVVTSFGIYIGLGALVVSVWHMPHLRSTDVASDGRGDIYSLFTDICVQVQLYFSYQDRCATVRTLFAIQGQFGTIADTFRTSRYLWNPENAGLIALGNVIGYGLAVPLTWTSDWLAAYLTRRNNGIREAEMRLGVLIPAGIIAPCGLIVFGMTAQRDLHWVGYFAGVAMCDWGSYFFFTFTLAYAIDSCKAYVKFHACFVR